MHDFGSINLKGMSGVLKARNYYKKPATPKERTFVITGGPGCDPDPARGRKIEVRTGPKEHETISSYDFEYIFDGDGKKIMPKVMENIDAFVCEVKAPTPEAPKQVRRKR